MQGQPIEEQSGDGDHENSDENEGETH